MTEVLCRDGISLNPLTPEAHMALIHSISTISVIRSGILSSIRHYWCLIGRILGVRGSLDPLAARALIDLHSALNMAINAERARLEAVDAQLLELFSFNLTDPSDPLLQYIIKKIDHTKNGQLV